MRLMLAAGAVYVGFVTWLFLREPPDVEPETEYDADWTR